MNAKEISSQAKEFLIDRLQILLKDFYEDFKTAQGKRNMQKAHHIQGYMEACIASSLLTRKTLEGIINQAHMEVLGVAYEAKTTPDKNDIDWLDIPTVLRKK